MFVVTFKPTFSHPVKVLVPVDGGHEESTFRATFNVLTAEQEDSFDLSTSKGSDDFLRALIVRFDELLDAENKPLNYSDAVRDQLLAWSFIRTALTRTYFAAMKKAAEGN